MVQQPLVGQQTLGEKPAATTVIQVTQTNTNSNKNNNDECCDLGSIGKCFCCAIVIDVLFILIGIIIMSA